MEKTAYLVLARDKDTFSVIYAGDCSRTDDAGYLVQHEQFKCWASKASSEGALYIAILPVEDDSRRRAALGRIIERYRPACNKLDGAGDPGYAVRGSGAR